MRLLRLLLRLLGLYLLFLGHDSIHHTIQITFFHVVETNIHGYICWLSHCGLLYGRLCHILIFISILVTLLYWCVIHHLWFLSLCLRLSLCLGLCLCKSLSLSLCLSLLLCPFLLLLLHHHLLPERGWLLLRIIHIILIFRSSWLHIDMCSSLLLLLKHLRCLNLSLLNGLSLLKSRPCLRILLLLLR